MNEKTELQSKKNHFLKSTGPRSGRGKIWTLHPWAYSWNHHPNLPCVLVFQEQDREGNLR